MNPAPMHWVVAAPFTSDPETDRWLVPFVPPGRQRFTLVPAGLRPSWHERPSRTAGFLDWTTSWRQAAAAWRALFGRG